MDKLRIYLTFLLTFLFTLSGVNGNSDTTVIVPTYDVMYAAYDQQAYENDADEYDTFVDGEGITTATYNFTTAKRHIRSNVRRKVHGSSTGGLFNGGYSICHPTYNDICRNTYSGPSGLNCHDYLVKLGRLII